MFKRASFIFLFCFSTLISVESKNQQQDEQNITLDQEELTNAQKLWGRKFQASLGYGYFAGNYHGLDIGYGVWDHNQLGILASIFFPLNQNDKIYLVSFFGVWDWNPIPWLSIMPKVGYGAKIYKTKLYDYLSWEPTMGIDLTFHLTSMVKVYTSYTWSMYHNQNHKLEQLNGVSMGVRIAY